MMMLPSRIAVRGFRSALEIKRRFHGRINSRPFLGAHQRSLLMVIRQVIWDEGAQAFVIQIQPVISRQSWIGNSQDRGAELEPAVLFPEVDLNELFQDATVLEYVEQ